MKLLTQSFLDQYPDFPEHMTEIGMFTYLRTYSRWLPDQNRRETWKETVARSVDYNVSLGVKELSKYSSTVDVNLLDLVKEAELLFDSVFNLKQFLSGRTHWIGGAESGAAEKYPLANFNCSFMNIKSFDDLGDLFYLLMVGTGTGFKCTQEFAKGLPPVRTNFKLEHAEYKPLPKSERIENTVLHVLDNGYAKIWVGDSKEGWVESFRTFFRLITQPEFEFIHTIKISYNSIRPKGDRLVTFGGTASGHEPLQLLYSSIFDTLNNRLDPDLEPLEDVGWIVYEHDGDQQAIGTPYRKLRPIHILDIGNQIGNIVVVGGVRRSAQIFLMDADDWECILAKYGINGVWDKEHHGKVIQKMRDIGIVVPEWMYKLRLNDFNARPLRHRSMSNNSIAFTSKPSKEFLELIFLIMQGEGEPAFINMEEANRRRPNAEGLNPCAEILLDSYGVCNLTTVNADAFVNWDDAQQKYVFDLNGFVQAQELSTRAGIRMTCVDLELPHWDYIQKRDRLIGTSKTGWKDAMGKLGYSKWEEDKLLELSKETVRNESIRYSHKLRIPQPLLDTTVKPEGTLSLVAGAKSAGLHHSFAPYYIRRIRINADDALVKVVQQLGWDVEESVTNKNTLVVSFPVKSGAITTIDQQTVKSQFDTYFAFQESYTSHNSSNTISVKPHEWEEAKEIVWENWDNFVGVSFLAHDGGTYQQAPYTVCTEAEYWEMKNRMKPFDYELLKQIESTNMATDNIDEACATGACPIR